MPITVTTTTQETYDGGTIAAETVDGNGLSLQEALDFLSVNAADDTILFDPSLTGSFIQIGATFISSNVIIDGDVDNNGSADIVIIMQENAMTIDTDGASLNLDNVHLDFTNTIDFYRDGAVNVTAENVTLTNSGVLSSQGIPSSFSSDRSVAVRTTADNFTLVNEASGVIDSAGRFGVEAGTYSGPNFENFVADNTTITNHGLIEGEDDGIRMGSGDITNTGIIRGTGGYDLNSTDPDTPTGVTSDGITAITFDQDADFSIPSTGRVNIDNSGLIEGDRSGILQDGGGILDNSGTIVGDGFGIISQSFGLFGPGAGNVTDYSHTITNSGLIERLGLDDKHVEFSFGDLSAISLGGGNNFTDVSINNSGIIRSADMAINTSQIAMTLVNDVTGQILSGNTGGSLRDVAFKASQLDDFTITASVTFTSLFRTPISSQNINYDANTQMLTFDGFTYDVAGIQFAQSFLSVDSNFVIIPLIDSAASQSANQIVFQTDVAGNEIFPASVDVPTTNSGIVTVNYTGIYEFTVVDSNGDTVYETPSNIDFTDDITNFGLIDGDIYTGLGSDIILNDGMIDGDVYLGLGNDDYTTGSSGLQSAGDYVYGGDGADILRGGAGDDNLDGGAGRDRLVGGDGEDFLRGGDDTDFLIGGNARDRMFGGNQSDRLFGGNGNDIMLGQGSNDLMYGGGNNDVMYGGLGNDTLNGGSNFDRLYGGENRDKLFGGNSPDLIDGGAGNDTLWGGTGNGFDGSKDTFIFEDGFGSDVIKDFEDGIDLIDFSGHTNFNSFADVMNAATDDGTNLTILLDSNNTIFIENFTLAELDSSDFVF